MEHIVVSDTLEDGKSPTAISCTLCGVLSANVQEQRNHARSDLHGYNLKQKTRGLKPVNEVDFEKMIGDLDESISGSESSASESDTDNEADSKRKGNGTMLSALLKKQANIGEPELEDFSVKKSKCGSGRPPLLWFTTPVLSKNTSLGMYRAIFTNTEQQEEAHLVDTIRNKQVSLAPKSRAAAADEGGVLLPNTYTSPHLFMCMIGGGHFAGMIVSLVPKMGKKHGTEERQASVLAHKTFHRYTTRRKQGGAQSSNDAAKGAAHSAGASLRRYNEVALTAEIRELLAEWKDMIDSSQLLFIRATGSANRRTLFGSYDGQVMRSDDPRIRGFPFSTRRATQAELMRCFVELTRVKVSEVDEAALIEAHAKAEAEAQSAAAAQVKAISAKTSLPPKSIEEETAILHTTQIESLIRRSKAPTLLSYFSSNSLDPNFRFYPTESQAHHHAPTPLHLAASINSPAVVIALVVKGGADPTLTNAQGRTAFEVAGDRATRDAFRQSRSVLGEKKWDWDGGAKVPEALSKAEVEIRNKHEKEEEEHAEEARRKAGMEGLKLEESRKEEERRRNGDDRREKKIGKGHLLSAGRERTAEERREEEARGMTPEMRMRLERERRARAAEERMRRMQTAGLGAGR